MAITEHDLETMETWLDGDLTEELAEVLQHRLAVEPELVHAIEQLRADRQMRSRFFQALEPNDRQVDTLVNEVRRSIRREEIWLSRLRTVRNLSAMAASIAVVFMAGWLSHGRLRIGPVNPPTEQLTVVRATPLPQANNSNAQNVQLVSNPNLVLTPNPNIHAQPVQIQILTSPNLDLRAVPVRSQFSAVRPTHKLQLIDPFDRVIASGEIERLEDAQSLVADLQSLVADLADKVQWNLQSQPVQPQRRSGELQFINEQK